MSVLPLDQLPAVMARTVAGWLPAVDEAAYVAFLDMMVHYTRDSGDRLRHAAGVCVDPELRGFFAELADDEQEHWRLAEADLAEFGRRPTIEAPGEVAAFDRFWRGLGARDELVLLGALYVLEAVAGHLQGEARAALQRLGLTRKQARFILVHLDVDAKHGARAEELARERAQRDASALGRGASEAAAHWLAIHRKALVVDGRPG